MSRSRRSFTAIRAHLVLSLFIGYGSGSVLANGERERSLLVKVISGCCDGVGLELGIWLREV